MSAESIPQYRDLRCRKCLQIYRVPLELSTGGNWRCQKCGASNGETRLPNGSNGGKMTRGDVLAVVGGLGSGLVLLIIGLVLHAAFDAKAALCNSGFGLLGQEMAGASAQAECAGWNFGDGMAGVLTWMGGLLLAGTIVVGILFAMVKRQQRVA